MAITYTWKLTGLKKVDSATLSGIVFQTYWKKIGTDEDGNEGTFTGATPLDPTSVDPNNFVPFESLTEEIVLNWIKSKVTGSYEQHVNEQIAKQINLLKRPEVEIREDQFPWASTSTTSTIAGSNIG